MPRKRRLSKERDTRITVRAIEIFDAMMRIRCSCDPDDRNTKCAGCRRYDLLDEQLGLELKTPVWQLPTIARPGGVCPYPPGHAGCAWWENRDRAAEKLWLALDQASRAARTARKSSAENSANDVAATDTSPARHLQ